MKRKWVIWLAVIVTFMLLCNFTIAFNNLAKLFGEGVLFDEFNYYVTKDKKLVTGALNNHYYKSDYDRYNYYLTYRKENPDADTTLYRIESKYFYRFWRWREYMTEPKWKQPYMEMSFVEWNKIFNNMYLYREKYGTPFPRDTTAVFKK